VKVNNHTEIGLKHDYNLNSFFFLLTEALKLISFWSVGSVLSSFWDFFFFLNNNFGLFSNFINFIWQVMKVLVYVYSIFGAFYYFCVVILVENMTLVCGCQIDVKVWRPFDFHILPVFWRQCLTLIGCLFNINYFHTQRHISYFHYILF